jgi:DNA-binding NarL/FixJ family response regulator
MLREIRGVIGFDAMLCLATVRGGTRIYIPGTVPESHWLSQLIGPDLSNKLAKHFAINGKSEPRGAQVELPLLPKELQILHLTNEGKSINTIALALGISARTVSHHRKRLREAND